MNYKGLYPLYTNSKEDKEEALEYLVRDMDKALNSAIGYIHIDGTDEILSDKTPDDIKDYIFRNIIISMYGENTSNIANFKIVQQVLLDKYYDYFLKYIELCGYRASYVYMFPSTISTQYIALKSKDKNFIPYNRWNPKEYWSDYSYDPLNKRKNILNPLNGMMHLYINIYGSSEKERNNIILLKNYFNGNLYGNYMNERSHSILTIKLLPSKNFFPIVLFKKGIEKFL